MRIITLNANGIRSAASKGVFTWLAQQNADVVCIQESKAQEHQLADLHFPTGYTCRYHDAQKKGYSGVAIYSRVPPSSWQLGLGWPEIDAEGRWIEARFAELSVISVYLPSGSSGEERQGFKMALLQRLVPYLAQLHASGRAYIICGDFNVAHTKLDLKNWRGNQKNSGFLPEERAWMDEILAQGWCDAYRVVEPQTEQYTWWSNRGQAWANNVGWRIDYQLISANLRDKVQAAQVYTQQRFSDHAPLIVDYAVAANRL